MSWTRRWHRSASAVLLIGAGAQLAAHGRGLHPLRDGAAAATLAADSLWLAVGFHSLGFAALLALLGTTHWVLAREAEPRVLRRHALRNALLGTLATAALGWLHPWPPGLLVLGGASALYALAAWPRPQDL